MSAKDIWLTDMGQCRPSEALCQTAKRGHWQLVEYTTDELSGTMALTRLETGAPQITLPLNARGWHAVYLGFMGRAWAGEPLLKVRLSGDPCFVLVETEADIRHLEEGFWKAADLTGQDLVIAQQTTGEPRPASLAYVRLVPLADGEVRAYQDRSETKRLVAMNDGDACLYKGTFSAEDILEEVEPYRHTDFGKLFMEMWIGDHAHYPAEVGVPCGEGVEDFPQPIYRRIAEGARGMRERGVNPLQVALGHAHRIGLEFYAGLRFLLGMCPPSEVFEGPFFRDHPQWRCRDVDGTEISHPSFAFPEVRGYVLSLLEDTARYDIDGLNLIFVRGQPYVLYEKPLVEAFERQTRMDATALADQDARWQWYERELMPTLWFGGRPGIEETDQQRITRLDELTEPVQRWLRFRSGSLTALMRGVRELVVALGKQQRVSAVVFANEADNFFYGLDVEAWIKEGLVDLIIPYPWPERVEIDMDFFVRISRASPCEVYPNIMPRRMGPSQYVEQALRYYEQGADGLAFWDANSRHTLLNQWQVVRELGHKDDLTEWMGMARSARRFLLLRTLGGYTVDRYHPGSGG